MNIYESWIAKMPIAHRGLFGENIPENSIASFKNAIKNNVAIEFDVTMLKDGTVVVFHDEKLARMTGQNGFISTLTLEEISNFTLDGTDEKIPTLSQALETINGQVPVLIEIKNFGKVGALEKEVWKILQNYKGEYAVSSLNPYTLEWFKNNATSVRRGQIASFFKNKEITGIRRFYLKRMALNKKISQPNFIVYQAEDMPNKYVKKYFHKIPVLTCSLKNADEEARLAGFIDNFLFDSYTPSAFQPQNRENASSEEV